MRKEPALGDHKNSCAKLDLNFILGEGLVSEQKNEMATSRKQTEEGTEQIR